MNKTLASIAVAVLAGLGSANATVYSDVDDYSKLLGVDRGQQTTLYGEFNIVKGDGGRLDRAGFQPGCETVTCGEAWFLFVDDQFCDKEEKVKVTLGSDVLKGGGFVWGFSFLGGAISGDLLADLNADGILKYTIKATKGDFYVKQAGLIVEAHKTCVPDGGTSLALLGLGLIGLAGFGRKNLR